MALRLRIVSDNAESAGEFDRWTFGVNGGRIGRSLDNDWILIDAERYISAHHAEIEHRAGEWWISDLSTNGTYINGSNRPLGRGGRHRIADGDQFRLGPYEMVVQITGGNDFAAEQDFSLTETALEDVFKPDLPGSAAPGNDRPQAARPTAARPARSKADERAKAPRRSASSDPSKPARPPGEDERAVWPGLSAFCKGAGIDPFSLPAETRSRVLHEAGLAMREMMLGLMDLSRSRAEFTRELGISGGGRQRDGTSPLMQITAVEEALLLLLSGRGPTAGRAVDEVRAQFAKTRHHQQAILVALREAVPALLERLDPDELEQQFGRAGARGTATVEAQARFWTRYREMHRASMTRGETGLPPGFVEEFARAYQALAAVGLRLAVASDDSA